MDKQELYNRNIKLAQQLCAMLSQCGKTLSTAESCTGGMIGATITSVSGASECYGFGFVTYANEAKIRLIGVKESTLQTYGAVSSFTAEEMARGALDVSGADFAVSVTGIAGPGGGSKEKPVGLVYIGFASKDGICFAEKNNFDGNRDEVRLRTVNKALETVINNIRE